MTYTLTTAGLRAYKTWYTAIQKQDGLFLPDKPVLTAAAYASLFHFFTTHGSGFFVPGPPIEERMAPVYSRVIDTAQFREFLKIPVVVAQDSLQVLPSEAASSACNVAVLELQVEELQRWLSRTSKCSPATVQKSARERRGRSACHAEAWSCAKFNVQLHNHDRHLHKHV